MIDAYGGRKCILLLVPACLMPGIQSGSVDRLSSCTKTALIHGVA